MRWKRVHDYSKKMIPIFQEYNQPSDKQEITDTTTISTTEYKKGSFPRLFFLKAMPHSINFRFFDILKTRVLKVRKDVLVSKVFSILKWSSGSLPNGTFALRLAMDGFLITNGYSF